MAPASRYWFRAKTHGYGWGPPVTWQGWFVLLLFTVLLGLNTVLVSPLRSPVLFTLLVGALCLAMIGVCYAKGEPPKWRWGGR